MRSDRYWLDFDIARPGTVPGRFFVPEKALQNSHHCQASGEGKNTPFPEIPVHLETGAPHRSPQGVRIFGGPGGLARARYLVKIP